MKNLLSTLEQGVLTLFVPFTVMFIAVYALFTLPSAEKEPVSALAYTAHSEIVHQDSFQYHEQDPDDSPQDQLMVYSSQGDRRSWQIHNNIVDPTQNSIHSSGIEYSSLWATAPTGTLLFQQSTFSLNSNRL